MSVFWRGVLAFSLSVNLAAATMVTHHHLSSPRAGCSARCPWEAELASLDRDGLEAADLEAMRRSFEAFREGCHCEMGSLRKRLVEELLSAEIDEERVEAILLAMGERQVDLQRRLVEQIEVERAVLSPAAREIFDERLRARLVADAGSGCCPHGSQR